MRYSIPYKSQTQEEGEKRKRKGGRGGRKEVVEGSGVCVCMCVCVCVYVCVCVCMCVRAPRVYLCIGGPAGPGCCGQYEASAGGQGPAAVAAVLRVKKNQKPLPPDFGDSV